MKITIWCRNIVVEDVDPHLTVIQAKITAENTVWLESFPSEAIFQKFVRGVRCGAAAGGIFDVVIRDMCSTCNSEGVVPAITSTHASGGTFGTVPCTACSDE